MINIEKDEPKSLPSLNQRTPFPLEQTNSRKRSHSRSHDKPERIEYRETTMRIVTIKTMLFSKNQTNNRKRKIKRNVCVVDYDCVMLTRV